MAQFERQPESTLRIRFADCDPFNHLNNSRYIDYIINAREDQLRTYYNFDVHELNSEKGIGWVTAQTQLSYFQPAFLNELVTIQTLLLSAGEKILLVEALMWNADKKNLKAVMWLKLVHYNIRERKSQVHSAALMELFQQIVAPLPVTVNFEQRIAQLKMSVKTLT